MNFVDNIYEYLSPEKAYRRKKARIALDLSKRHYDGASTKGRLKDWTPLDIGGAGSSSQNSHAIDLMASRVSHLYNNSAPVKRGINAIANYTFGPGCIPHAVKPDGRKNDKLEDILKDFVDTPACDLEERETLYSKQTQAGIHVPRDGAFLIQRVWIKDKNSPLPFKLKCLTQDHIDKSKNKTGNYGARIVQGVEFDQHGRKTALWIKSESTSKRFPMADFCHIFRSTIAGQTHGITWGAPIIVKAKDFDDYMDAELLRQKIASCFVGLIHDIEGGLDCDPSAKLDGKITPGTWMTAPPGQTVEFSNPPQKEGVFEYVKIQHLGIASGLEVPYMIVSSDFSDSNYTQSRMTILDFTRSIESYQQHIFFPQMNYRIGRWILEACELSGKRISNTKIMWTYPRREFVDPVKDINSFILGVQNGFMSWEMAVREMGHDPDDVAKSIEASKGMLGDNFLMMEQNKNGA